ncbi:glycosyltransferase [Leptothermofonsia sichuanensis E412]|uniref:glycosyltransferase n=1 Tax=Leptothermofonsia sichuanensis TaxID=2917832 RepID=UPI001CA72A36|nr:glycosyltransferase [Leptothermofonsia sichuanensis]QZZ19424.1 glycosyltransferase [Leptothermofonsia sichuanensis E412]
MITDQYSRILPVPSGALQIQRFPQECSPDGVRKNAGLMTSVHFSLVVPTYNEGGNIDKIIRVLSQILDQAMPNDYELIVVDDDSPDLTWEQAQKLTIDYPNLRVMRRVDERGLSTAVIRGWQAARGEVLGVIDGDLQHPPEVLLQLLASIESGADLAVASRHVDGGGVSDWSLTRRILSRGAQMLGLILLPRVISRVSDPMSGYFVVRRRAIADQVMSPLGYKILIEVLGRGNIERIAEVGYVFQEREAGESKVTWKQYTDYLHHLLRLRLSSGQIGQLRQTISFPLGRFIRFGLVGATGLVVDMGVLYVLYDVLGLGLTRSAIFAAELAIINNFIWNDCWTFKDLAGKQRGWRKRIKRLAKFNAICLMGLILKILLLNLFFNGLQLNAYLANLLAIALVTLWNFWFNLQLSWRVTETK